MAVTPVFRGKIERGNVVLDDPYHYSTYKTTLEGKQISLSLKRWRENRSDQSNRYYWGVIIDILSKHCGYTPDEMHFALKQKFLSDHGYDDKGLMKIGSTAALTTDEFIDYTNRIVIWAAQDLKVYIPDPGHIEL
jgi:hypothetical protein